MNSGLHSSTSPFLGNMIATPHVAAELLGHEVEKNVQDRIRNTGALMRTPGVSAQRTRLSQEESLKDKA